MRQLIHNGIDKNPPEVRFTRLSPDAQVPVRATSGAAGYDLCACGDKPVVLEPGQRALIPTGLSIALPSNDVVALVFARSGMAFKRGLSMANGVGVIDSDYRGELCIPMINLSDKPQAVMPGDRVAQLCLMPVLAAVFTEAGSLPDTGRGSGGFGSTGV